jgi:hypothetical protein
MADENGRPHQEQHGTGLHSTAKLALPKAKFAGLKILALGRFPTANVCPQEDGGDSHDRSGEQNPNGQIHGVDCSENGRVKGNDLICRAAQLRLATSGATRAIWRRWL